MAEEPTNLVLVKLDEIRREQQALTHKVGAIAETLIGIKREIKMVGNRLENVEISVHRVGNDIGTLAVAIDEHTHRLNEIEKHLGIGTPQS